MPDIKTKQSVAGIKVIEKTVETTEQVKQLSTKAKEKTECSAEHSVETYATNRALHGTIVPAESTIYLYNKQGKKSLHNTINNAQQAKTHFKTSREKKLFDKQKKTVSSENSQEPVSNGRTISTKETQIDRNIKTRQSVTKHNIKTADKSITTANTDMQISKKSVNSAKKEYQVSKQSAKSAKKAPKTFKEITQRLKNYTQAVINETKAVVDAIVAGGWVATILIVLICIVAAVLYSVNGIFFSAEDNGTGMTINSAIQQINAEYDDKIDEIKTSSPYDEYEINGNRANWKVILAIYSVKTTTDPDNPQEVATVDSGKVDLLSNIFWDMNTIKSKVTTRIETKETEVIDEQGNKTTVIEDITIKALEISIESKLVDEMAEHYNFTDEQKMYLAELLDDKNNDLWNALIYNVNLSGTNIDIGSLNFENEIVNDTQKKIVAVATNSVSYGISARSGYCQAWVADVYQAVTGKRGSAHCALCAADSWGVSSDWSAIPVGATVYGYAHNPYGHVGIYIGNGNVIHNLSGTVTVQSLESWINGFNGFCWGYENNQFINS